MDTFMLPRVELRGTLHGYISSRYLPQVTKVVQTGNFFSYFRYFFYFFFINFNYFLFKKNYFF